MESKPVGVKVDRVTLQTFDKIAILCYKDIHQLMTIKTKRDEEMIANGILFYINPFSKGAVFGKGQLDIYLKKIHLDVELSHYQPCTNLEMIKRLLRKIIKQD